MEQIINRENYISENIITGFYLDKPVILFLEKELTEITKKHLSIKVVATNGVNSSLVITENDFVHETLLSLIKSMDDVANIDKVISLFSDIPLSEYLKLRGDFAEASFILNHGGEKIIGELKYDILLDGTYIEVKSYSSSQGIVTIKNSQINTSVQIVAADVYMDNNGITIIQLAEKISDRTFADELINKYTNTNAALMKFKISNFFTILPEEIEHNDTVQDMSIKFFIDQIKGDKYGK